MATRAQPPPGEKPKTPTLKSKRVQPAAGVSVAASSGGSAPGEQKKSLLGKQFTPKFTLGLDMKGQVGSEMFCVRYSPDGSLLAGSCGDNTVKLFNTKDGKQLHWLPAQGVVPLPCTTVRWRPQPASSKTRHVLVSADAGGNVMHWHVSSQKCLHTINQPGNQVFALDYKPDGSLFATAGYDRTVRLYDEATKSEIRALGGGFSYGGRYKTGHSNRVFSLKFGITDENLLLSGGWDNTIQIWDLRDVHPVRSIFGPHICGDSVDLRDNTVLTGSWRLENPLQVWDLPSGRLIREIPFNTWGDATTCLYAAQFSKDRHYSRVCAGGSGTHEARMFDTSTGDLIGRISGMTQGVYSVDFHPTLPQVAVGSGDGSVRIVDYTLDPTQGFQEMTDRAVRDLTGWFEI
eukprot:CAMPEP_0114559976 /NCGR_PEP_ID=MMETSP0114-20121206/11207_1 /TAXON_ID=31324 /ORGANISM="Goniomonas sp, Strain m" /LENGTH=402 /DNA_ID=CAMNT_0001745479 /DNA_START=9 /DNA_END=1218 /DNA_ORIENTATION=+